MKEEPGKALSDFIQLLYAIVIGLGFSDFAHGHSFQHLIGRALKIGELGTFFLFVAAMLFILSDYTVYAWLISTNPSIYRGRPGAFLFFMDLIILSIEYLLITVTCAELSLKQVEAFLFGLIIWHAVVCVWWFIYAIDHRTSQDWLVPRAHIFRAAVYLSIMGVFRGLQFFDIGGIGQAYMTSGSVDENAAGSIFVILLSIIVASFSVYRFLVYHNLLFSPT